MYYATHSLELFGASINLIIIRVDSSSGVMSWWTAGLLLAAAAPAHAHAPGRAPLGARRALLARRAPPAAMLAEVDRAGWCERVENAGQLAVVFFYAPWCRNCKAVRPKLQRIEKRYPAFNFYQVNFKVEEVRRAQSRIGQNRRF